MKTPLNPLNQLVESLQFLKQPEDDITPYELIASIHQGTINAISHLKAALETCRLNGLHEQAMQRYILICQQRLCAVMNELPTAWLNTELSSSHTIQENTALLRADICFQLDEFLIYLRDTFPAYFNRLLPLPNIHKEIIRQQLLPGIPLIKRWFDITEESCHDLQDLILDMFDQLEPASPQRLNDAKLQFLVQLHQHLLRLLDQENYNLQHHQLQYVLFCLNCNTTDFYHYCTTWLNRQLHKVNSLEEQMKLLKDTYTDMQQLQLRSGQAYCPDAPPIRDLLQEWLVVEIKFLERKMKEEPGLLITHEKIHTNMSVSMIALMLRLLRAMGQLSQKHVEEAFRLLPRYFMARRNETFTESIFRAKYKELTSSTLSRIVGIGQELLKMLKPEERTSKTRRSSL
ncbi:hypothetical protein [Chitinophaga sancti]|uniref:Uncharacterized protein n=1 Tax=Chitinophaga sancti TaxID=1004 RepID=A0A1K1S2J8_9BACT|nr:hypothetical protein [Chitinophaga sancti]WQD59676.1 hypothetical protein U0033_17450 [Chitinophaga sancti]WQG88193.1 hypothetical protein SR876_25015 [Chitinophaga sancti]SFW78303.1 hypothetical protein SAMN05661012_04626 [Chitinophaga sancti]